MIPDTNQKKQVSSNVQTAEDFLKICNNFKLGCLLTEQQNPKTIGLSQLASEDLPKAIQIIKDMDVETLMILDEKIPQIEKMQDDINYTLINGGRIFICGCGATGRLSLVLETLWRQEIKEIFESGKVPQEYRYQDWKEKVVSLMAGGDAALIKSIQDFQDHPEFGEQQLKELGFSEKDLLIGSTEGGQTPWVIGCVWYAVKNSIVKPYILYGNTDQILIKNSQKINNINCNVGHMALAGSTRMQSTTILMYAIGLALLGCNWMRKNTPGLEYTNWVSYAKNNVIKFTNYVKEIDFKVIAPLIEYESNLYKENREITYHTDPYFAISILTDTTERAPTFSLNPFPNRYNPESALKKCWCNMKLIYPQQNKSENETTNIYCNKKLYSTKQKPTEDEITNSYWSAMLGQRQIRGLNSQYWSKYAEKVSNRIISGFSLHNQYKQRMVIHHDPLEFIIETAQPPISVQFTPLNVPSNRLSQHILLKIIINNVSTLIMGRLNRYSSNIMTYVRPTNYKLIDRATRYVRLLLSNENIDSTYEEVVTVIYEIKNKIQEDEPIVLKAIERIKQKRKAQKDIMIS